MQALCPTPYSSLEDMRSATVTLFRDNFSDSVASQTTEAQAKIAFSRFLLPSITASELGVFRLRM